MFGGRPVELTFKTFSFTEEKKLVRFVSLDKPLISTLSQTTGDPGLEPGDFSTTKLGDTCNEANSATAANARQ